jgi:hypothetical protein
MKSDMRWGVRLIVKACCGLLIAFSIYGCNLASKSSVPASLTREERLKIAADAFLEFQCEKLWDALWPLAREGDGEALLSLAFDFSRGRLQLPDSDADTHPIDKQSANARAMAIYAAAAPSYASKSHLRLFLGATTDVDMVVVSLRSGSIGYLPIEAFPQTSTKKLRDCFSAASSPAASDRCAGLAAELGFAPRFSEYKKAVDDILARNGPRGCYRGH